MSYIGGAGALVLETQSNTGSWFNGFASTSDPVLGTVIGLSDDLVPSADNAFDIGTNLNRLRVLHTTKINDNAAGETLEIGNYTADTGVTGVYGQLQGKDGCWKLAKSGVSGTLAATNGHLILSAKTAFEVQSTNPLKVLNNSGFTVMNSAFTKTLVFTPPIGAANGSLTTADGLDITTGTTLNLTAGSSFSVTGATGVAITSTANDIGITGNRDVSVAATTRNLAMVAGNDASTTATRDVNLFATRYVNITSGAATGTYMSSDYGVVIRDTSYANGMIIRSAASGSSFSTFGGTSITLNVPTVTIGTFSTTTCNIAAGYSTASTTTTNIGCSVAGSTNTINIGQIAANDIINIIGTTVRQPEFISLYLASNTTLAFFGNNFPSMTTYQSYGLKYLSWNDTNRRFENSHPTKRLTVLIHISLEWGTTLGTKNVMIKWGPGGAGAQAGLLAFTASDTLFRGGSCVVTLDAAGGYAAPFILLSVINEIMNGSATVASNRATITATVI